MLKFTSHTAGLPCYIAEDSPVISIQGLEALPKTDYGEAIEARTKITLRDGSVYLVKETAMEVHSAFFPQPLYHVGQIVWAIKEIRQAHGGLLCPAGAPLKIRSVRNYLDGNKAVSLLVRVDAQSDSFVIKPHEVSLSLDNQ